MPARIVSNVLALCATSALAGAMMLIWRVLGSYWRSLPGAAFLDWFTAYGPMIGQVMFTLAGLGAAGLLASLWLDRADPRTRLFWIGALICLAGVGWITFAYEVPLNKAFETHAVPPDQVQAALDSWLLWHKGRALFGLCAAVLGVVALVRRLPGDATHSAALVSGRGLPPR